MFIEVTLCAFLNWGTIDCKAVEVPIPEPAVQVVEEVEATLDRKVCGWGPGDYAWGIPVPVEAVHSIYRAFPEEAHCKAVCVMRWESGFNPNAANPVSSARGPWQFLRGSWTAYSTHPDYAAMDPADVDLGERFDWWESTRLAAIVWEQDGWRPWVAARKC